MYVCTPISNDSNPASAPSFCPTYVYFTIFKPLLQIVVDSLVRNLADKREIRNSNLFLLGAFEDGLPDLGLSPSTARRLGIAIVLLPTGALCDCLFDLSQSAHLRKAWVKGPPTMVSFPVLDPKYRVTLRDEWTWVGFS